MRAVQQWGVRDIRVVEMDPPRPAPGEVVVATRAVTICASDLHSYSEGNVGGIAWDEPFVPGHEAAGVVADENGTGLAAGTPVVVDPAAPCLRCDQCADGAYHLCRHLRFLDLPPVHGAMRELFAWPASRAFALPTSVDLVEAPLIEPLAVGVHATELARLLAGGTAAVVGCGAIGLMTLQMARLRGARTVYALDLLPERLAVARAVGADETILVEPGREPAEAVLALTGGRGVDVAFEAAGPLKALLSCIQMTRPGGEVMVIGIPSEDEYRLSSSILRRHELRFQFVRRQNENFPEAISLAAQGRVALGPVLTHRFPCERAQEAFALAEQKRDGAVRVAITFPGG